MTISRLILVRITVVFILLVANFALGWYVYMRFVQLETPSDLAFQTEELNNPRLNKGLLNKIIKNFEMRKNYKEQDPEPIQIEEDSPFRD